MNYANIYNSIIDRALNRDWYSKKKKSGKNHTECYTETHHIIPKCLGGSNSKDNLAVLTAKEHFIAHYLLTKMYHDDSIILAFIIMCNRTDGKNSNDYQEQKEKFRAITSERMKIESNKPERKELARKVCIDRNTNPNFKKQLKESMTEERRKKISERSKKMWEDSEYKEKHRESMSKVFTEEFKIRMSEETKRQNRENPKLKEKRINSIKRKHNTSDQNRKIGIASKEYNNRPEVKQRLSERNSGGGNPMARKVVNFKTGQIFNTIKDAALDSGLNLSTFKKYLYNKMFDKIDYMLYNDYVEGGYDGKK